MLTFRYRFLADNDNIQDEILRATLLARRYWYTSLVAAVFLAGLASYIQSTPVSWGGSGLRLIRALHRGSVTEEIYLLQIHDLFCRR